MYNIHYAFKCKWNINVLLPPPLYENRADQSLYCWYKRKSLKPGYE